MMMVGSSSIAFGVVLVFLDKDVYEIPTPNNPLTIFIDSPGKVIISVSNGEIATVLGETTSVSLQFTMMIIISWKVQC